MWNPSAYSFTLATSWLCVGLTHRGLQHQTCYSNALKHPPPKKKSKSCPFFARLFPFDISCLVVTNVSVKHLDIYHLPPSHSFTCKPSSPSTQPALLQNSSTLVLPLKHIAPSSIPPKVDAGTHPTAVSPSPRINNMATAAYTGDGRCMARNARRGLAIPPAIPVSLPPPRASVILAPQLRDIPPTTTLTSELLSSSARVEAAFFSIPLGGLRDAGC